jgi:hypothetical protein
MTLRFRRLGFRNHEEQGLRLLTYVGGQYFLIAEDWRPRRGVVVMLRESAAIRLELGRP